MKKFFLISQVFYPDEVSTADLFTGLCKVLASRGFSVEVWSAQPSYTSSAKQPKFRKIDDILIRYLQSTRFHKSSLPGRAMNIITFMMSTIIRLLASSEMSPVFTHTTPPFLGIIVSAVCRLKKRKFVYILLDIFPEGLIRLGKLSKNNPLVVLWRTMFINSLKRSEKIIVLGRDMAEYIEAIYPQGIKKIEYVPHWQDDKIIYPENFEDNVFIKNNSLENRFVVQYSGNMGLWNEMRTLGKAAKKISADVIMLLVGDGLRKKELLEELTDHDMNNLLLVPFQPKSNLNNILNACHVQIVTLIGGMEGMAVPCKIYGILAAAKPVIGLVPSDSEIAFIINEENCGMVIKPDDTEGLVTAIEKLRLDNSLRMKMGENSRAAFLKKYTIDIIAEKYATLINEI